MNFEHLNNEHLRFWMEDNAAYAEMQHPVAPRYTPELLDSHSRSAAYFENEEELPFEWLIHCSANQKAFCYGGDLELFVKAVKTKNRDLMQNYAIGCAYNVLTNLEAFSHNVGTVAVVEGAALGGGFEIALSCDRIFATPESTFGFPEIRHGAFPGAGGVSMLQRRLGRSQASEMLTTGRIYSAAEVLALGLIDEIAPDATVRAKAWMLEHEEQGDTKGIIGLFRARQRAEGIDWEELRDIAMQWAETVMNIEPHYVEFLKKIITLQNKISKRN